MLENEASWTLKQLLANNLINNEDTAVICQSWNNLNAYLTHLKSAFPKETLHAIAIKTNPHPEVLKYVVKLGFGLEAASLEEVQLALSAGASHDKIVFDSPVKTQREINYCHENLAGIKLNVNSLEELMRIPKNPSFTIGIRINPLIDAGSPTLYHVSSDESKFGVPLTEKENILNAICQYPITRLHVHAGSCMANLESAVLAIEKLFNLAEEANEILARNGIERRIEMLDIGGGLPPEKLISGTKSFMEQYRNRLEEKIPNFKNYQLITEFGQWVYFYTGYAFSQIEYVLKRGEKEIVFIHLGADYLMRDAYSKPRGIVFKTFTQQGLINHSEQKKYDIAGPLCFAGDYLIKNETLHKPEEGNWMALLNTGSNSLGLWSRHCSRAIPKVIGVDLENEKIEVISDRKIV